MNFETGFVELMTNEKILNLGHYLDATGYGKDIKIRALGSCHDCFGCICCNLRVLRWHYELIFCVFDQLLRSWQEHCRDLSESL